MEDLLAATIDKNLNFEERLFVVEGDLQAMKVLRDQKGEDEALSWLLLDLSAFTFDQAIFSYEVGDDGNISKEEAYGKLIDIAQSIWESIASYIKDTADIELHTLAMLSVMHGIYTDELESSDLVVATQAKYIVNAINAKIEKVLSDVPKEFYTVQAVPVPDIDNATDMDWLNSEFFRTISKLGTFKRNRDEYDTDDQRALHDRLMAIYNRLGELKN